MIRKLLYLCTDNTDPYHNLALEQYLTDTVRKTKDDLFGMVRTRERG